MKEDLIKQLAKLLIRIVNATEEELEYLGKEVEFMEQKLNTSEKEKFKKRLVNMLKM